jgi:hypothetical protein
MYQIHRDGETQTTLLKFRGHLCGCVKATDGRYVVEVDIFDKVDADLREFPANSDSFLHVPGH